MAMVMAAATATEARDMTPIDSLTRIQENTYMSVVDPSTEISQVFSTATQASTSSDFLNAFLLTEW